MSDHNSLMNGVCGGGISNLYMYIIITYFIIDQLYPTD